ncbi:DUF2975 domain-containing protein [Emticicia sp. BO119]|uniref:DUF2975 domain-containing protein n=1 Tax=Emticicia sp. BO119 TaxID=2757768 RepID=UPI0015F0C58B|nr:DUF2975 domain-containing protein [Emticicia sp. BO119]MBA4851453.1 DUF2975 domain-containing protein [Emticicia sp. BO119]
MKTRTQNILSVVRIIALIGYIGAIVAGLRIAIPFVIGFITDKLSFDTGTGLDSLQETHLLSYVFMMSFIIVLAIMKIQVWEKLREILEEINLSSPFSNKIASMLENMSYIIAGIGLIYFMADIYANNLSKTISMIDKHYFKSDFQYLFSAGVVYVMAQIFRRGVEIQEENDLTV